MITIIPIEPLSEAHGMLIVAAFNRHFVDRGGKEDGRGDGFGYGDSRGDGWGSGRAPYVRGNVPEEWRAE